MGCFLRVSGLDFDISSYLPPPSFQRASIMAFRKGMPISASRPNWKTYECSGVSLTVSDAELDQFPTMLRAAEAFIRGNRRELQELIGLPGAQEALMEFGVATRDDVAIQTEVFPAAILEAAGALGIAIGLTRWPFRAEDEDNPPVLPASIGNAVPGLIQQLDGTPDESVVTAALALRSIGGDVAVDALLRALSAPHGKDAKSALAYALGGLDCCRHFREVVALAFGDDSSISVSARAILCEQAFYVNDAGVLDAIAELERWRERVSDDSGYSACKRALANLLAQRSGT